MTGCGQVLHYILIDSQVTEWVKGLESANLQGLLERSCSILFRSTAVRTPQQLHLCWYCSVNNNQEEHGFYQVLLSDLFHLFPLHLSTCSSLQGSGPEDFSHLPPEQRRKKLQGKLDDLNKDIQKEMDQRYFRAPMHSERTLWGWS